MRKSELMQDKSNRKVMNTKDDLKGKPIYAGWYCPIGEFGHFAIAKEATQEQIDAHLKTHPTSTAGDNGWEKEFKKVWSEAMFSSNSAIALEGKSVKQFISDLLAQEREKARKEGYEEARHEAQIDDEAKGH